MTELEIYMHVPLPRWNWCLSSFIKTSFVPILEKYPIRTSYPINTAIWLENLFCTRRKIVLNSFMTIRRGQSYFRWFVRACVDWLFCYFLFIVCFTGVVPSIWIVIIWTYMVSYVKLIFYFDFKIVKEWKFSLNSPLECLQVKHIIYLTCLFPLRATTLHLVFIQNHCFVFIRDRCKYCNFSWNVILLFAWCLCNLIKTFMFLLFL